MKILHKSLSFVALVLAMTAFTNCTKHQTSLSIEDIKGEVTIIGNISYSEGQDFVDGAFIENYRPAADKIVYVKVSNASLSPNGNSVGYTTFDVKTDAEGNYEIKVPAVEGTTGTDIIISTEKFIGTFQKLVDWKNAAPVFEKEEVVFTAAEKTVNLKPGDIEVYNAVYSYNPINSEENFTLSLPLYGKVGFGEYFLYNNVIHPIFAAKEGVNAIVTVTYPYYENVNGTPTAIVRKFGATTNANGDFVINIPAKEEGESITAQVEIADIYTDKFIYSYDNAGTPENKILEGVYKQSAPYASTSNQTYSFPTLKNNKGEYLIDTYIRATMVFNALPNGQDTGNYDPSTFYTEDTWGTESIIVTK